VQFLKERVPIAVVEVWSISLLLLVVSEARKSLCLFKLG
jgi:hypothetical protein